MLVQFFGNKGTCIKVTFLLREKLLFKVWNLCIRSIFWSWRMLNLSEIKSIRIILAEKSWSRFAFVTFWITNGFSSVTRTIVDELFEIEFRLLRNQELHNLRDTSYKLMICSLRTLFVVIILFSFLQCRTTSPVNLAWRHQYIYSIQRSLRNKYWRKCVYCNLK